jgi:hypothetical protein
MIKGRKFSKSRNDWKLVQNAKRLANLDVTPQEEFEFACLTDK